MLVLIDEQELKLLRDMAVENGRLMEAIQAHNLTFPFRPEPENNSVRKQWTGPCGVIVHIECPLGCDYGLGDFIDGNLGGH